nr:uncharacterized protein LOC119178041 [Rhipicephalus microplus]
MAQHISDDRANLRKIRPVPRRFPAMQRAAADVRDAALSSYELSQASLSATEDSPSQAAVLLEGKYLPALCKMTMCHRCHPALQLARITIESQRDTLGHAAYFCDNKNRAAQRAKAATSIVRWPERLQDYQAVLVCARGQV